ncbi:MAG: thioredoxin domain-containing protein [Deltaproteobacteria bacterium]|nr:thioredoxin domain-containing protein [Deltaproteobacteria bacterium]MBN2670983.1 thioredoxin domain-containing protein [Deltaproteobacteria bacterium]
MKKILAFVFVAASVAMFAVGCGPKKNGGDSKPAEVKEEVTIDLFVMSQCPYGVQAVDGFYPLLEKFGGQVGLNVNYIGQKKPDGSLSSMHGEKEVQGDISQLCAKEIAPSKKEYWAYMTCVNEKWREIPQHDAECATTAKLDAAKFKACTEGEQGKKLLSASFDLAKTKGATGSPSIFIGEERYSGNRSDKALEQYICNKFGKEKGLNYCNNMEPPAEVKLIAITDKRCGAPCDTSKMIQSLNGIFMGLKPTVMDWSDAEAQKIAKAANVTKLPALLFDGSVEKDDGGFKHMQRWLTKTGDYYLVKVKADFDPNAEICDNKKDDTGNGLVDCDDESCKNTLTCRPQTEKTLEVFVMSQCPFGAMAVNAMGEVLEAFGSDMDFQLHFIGNMAGDKISSMHGQSEVDENIRWACAKKLYPNNNDYLKYVWCRAEDYKNPDWKKCATGPIKAAAIEKCFNEEGTELLKEDIAIANGLGIGASPTWIVNGTTKFSGVTPKAIQDNFCKANAGLKGCDKPLSNDRASKAPAGSCGG